MLSRDFGKGWLSRNARDLMQVAIVFGGFDEQELIKRVVRAGKPSQDTNITTVENILGEMKHEADNSEGELA